MISQRCLNRTPRPPRTAFRRDHTHNTKTRLFSKVFILHTVLGDSPHIFCGFATVKRTEWNVRKASPYSYAFRKRPWLPKSERQSDRKAICRLSLPVAYEMWFMETDLDWRTCLKATHAEENRTAPEKSLQSSEMERKWLILVREDSL